MPHFAHCPGAVLGLALVNVVKVERIEASVMTGPDGKESEALGQEYLAGIYPGTLPEDYILTHYSVNQPDPYPRGKFAGVGDTWDGTQFATPGVDQDQADPT